MKKRAQGALSVLPRWSIDHPQAVIAFYTAVLALAAMAIHGTIPRRFAPYVQSPMLGVVTMMPGLSAQDMERDFSKPIEEQLINIEGLRFIRSSSQDGFSMVTLEFHYGTDMHRALTEVNSLMNLVAASLPASGANLKPSFVVPIDPLNIPVLSLSLTGDPKDGWNPPAVRQFAENTVVARLKAVPSVESTVIFGGYHRQMQVIVDRTKLAAYGLSMLDVKRAIDRFNTSRPGGILTKGRHEITVRVNNAVRHPADLLSCPIRRMLVGPDRAPRVICVRDVARVEDTFWERRSGFHYLSHAPGTPGTVTPSIEVSVVMDPGASSAQVVPAVMRAVGALEQAHPGLHFRIAYNNAHFVNVLFDNVWHELGLAVLLTGLALLFFLGEWRSTLIAMITLPTSLAFAVLMLVPAGMTFNSGTLIGLLLSIGRLVDDAIIDIHAVERHLRMGKSPRQATIDGIAEVRVAVLASTLMICIALAPLLFAGGLVGLMFVELVWPLLFGLLASMVVSFTLTALLCARFLRPEGAREAERKRLRWLYRVLDPCGRWLERLEHGYAALIDRMLENRFSNVIRILVTVVVGFTFYYFIGSEMMPLADVGQANGFLEMAPGTSYAQTAHAVGQLEQIILKSPEVEKASIEIGKESMFESFTPFYTGYQMPAVNGASMMLTLSDRSQRRRSIWQIIDAIQSQAMRTIPGLRRLQIKEMGSDVMATAEAPIQVNIYGPDLAELNRLGHEVLAVARRMPELVQPALTSTMALPEEEVKVDPVRAEALGLSPRGVAEQAYYALHGGLTDTFLRLPNLRQDTILLRYRHAARATPSDLANLYLTGADGREVPLESVARIVWKRAPTVIEHDGLRRVVGITGYYRTDRLPSMDVVMNLIANVYGGNPALGIRPVNFPPGYGLQMRGDMTQMMNSFRRLMRGLLLSLLLMYLVLVAQFRGFLQPLQMLMSLPLELAGVFTALFIAHQSFSTVSMLGIIVLTGMDITTAVLLIDRIMKNREAGLPRSQAVREACAQRLRPILMTAGISMLVMLPVAVAPRTGLDAYQPLATAVVGGLLVGTTLSLFDIPLMHTLVDDLGNAAGRLLSSASVDPADPAASTKGAVREEGAMEEDVDSAGEMEEGERS